jgi:hypothetical protein
LWFGRHLNTQTYHVTATASACPYNGASTGGHSYIRDRTSSHSYQGGVCWTGYG